MCRDLPPETSRLRAAVLLYFLFPVKDEKRQESRGKCTAKQRNKDIRKTVMYSYYQQRVIFDA